MVTQSASTRATGKRKRAAEPARRDEAARGPQLHRQRLWPVLLAVWGFALAIRLVYLWQIHGSPYLGLRLGDGIEYHAWAQSIARGDWLGHGVFYQAPLYPYFLALVYRLLDDSVTTVRLIQSLLGACSCTLLAAAGVKIFGRRGALAGVLLAVFPPAIFLDSLIEKSALATFLAAALLALISAPAERMTLRRWLALGVTLGLLSLTRENALVLAVPLLCWIAIGPFPGTARARVAPALVFLAGCALILLPVGLRNLAVGGEFHLTTSQFGPNFYIGNHAGAEGTYAALVVGHGSVKDEREDATRLAEQAAGRRLGPGDVSDFWTNRALDYIRSEPASWLKLTVRKIALTFNSIEITDTESQNVYAEESWLLKIPFDFGLLFGMAAMGVVLTAASWRRIWFLYAILATYALSVALFYVFARYRFPIVLILMLLAAGGLVEVFDRVKLRRYRTLAAPAAAAALAIAISHLPLDDPHRYRATHYLSVAIALSTDPAQADLAMAFYRRALDAAPQLPSAEVGLGAILSRLGRQEEAIPYLRKALESWPESVEAHFDLGVALAAAGQPQEAAQEYTEALRLSPGDAAVHIAFAKTLTVLNHPDLAVGHFQQGLAVRPKDVNGLVGLGAALTRLGRTEQAIPELPAGAGDRSQRCGRSQRSGLDAGKPGTCCRSCTSL